MNVFSAKSIGLYSLAIGSAIVFFNFVTSYGEANIAAPPPMAGNYPIIAENLTGCLAHKTLLLNIQQSGIYLNANLNLIDVKNPDIRQSKVKDRSATTPTTQSRPTFSGRLTGRQLHLSGLIPVTSCPISSRLQISGSISSRGTQNSHQIQGQLQLTDRAQPQGLPVNFTATQQPLIPSTSSPH